MFSFLKYGPNKKIVKFSIWLSWPIIIAAKKLSSYPIFKWIINPFFAYPYNEVTAIPINAEVKLPENVVLPTKIVEEILRRSADIFILDECICRAKMDCKNHPKDIGCIALGRAARRIHPSHGRFVSTEKGIAHIRRAADSGLVANVAHVWIDPVAFHTVPFDRLMFICFCDDCCCLYRTHMKKRGPNLDKAYKKLPGISIEVDPELCTGCGICEDSCFVSEMKIVDGVAKVGDGCKACGRCLEVCPENAISLRMDSLDILIDRMMERINAVADITSS